MKSIHIIHFVESNNRHEWLENLISLLNAEGFTQTLISVEPQGAISAYLSDNYENIYVNTKRQHRLNVFTGVREVIRSRRRDSINVVFALGHPAAVITGVASCLVRTNFVFSHMQQPHYFDYMKPKWKGILHTLLYRFYLSRASLIHSLSQEVTQSLIKHGVNQERILSVFIGVDFSKIHRQLLDESVDLVLPQVSPKILMVGRLAPEKNYEMAFRAFALFLKNNSQALILIAGDGPLKKALNSLAKQLNITNSVHFLGYVENVPALMSKVDVLLHLATTESYGQIYIEAVLSGLPIVCTATGVAIDFAEDKNIDIHISTNDSEKGIADNLEYCLSNIKISPLDRDARFSSQYKHDEKYVHTQIVNNFAKFSIALDSE